MSSGGAGQIGLQFWRAEALERLLSRKKVRMLAYSSLLFLVPCFYAYQNTQPLAFTSLSFLTGTSLLYHTKKGPVTFWIDQVAVYGTVVSAFLYGYEGGIYTFIIPTIGNLWNSYVYFYGYQTKSLVFHPDPNVADAWHATIHLVSSLSYLFLLYQS